ncbi:TcaA NTF2-like domain-containing protein [Streptococcus moroccensis]|uniref:Uncharacterized protein n=1 Tax=Streptococcus moroccensis TaxID=1451356 RepID=A0ABT9YSZ3_9STRE|nr:hypothetical protein [Streptococcus moroccensis]MDQ0223111.1 hypothetical protein [Streptococcus moroccensis]
MQNQQKWIDLFEKVIGRKPSPQEFMAGKESGFDLKQIKTIAGLNVEMMEKASPEIPQTAPLQEQVSSPQQVVPVQTPPVVPVQEMVQPIPTTPETQAMPKQVGSNKNKTKRYVGVLAAALVVALAGGYYYMDQKTGSDVAAQKFIEAIQKEDYSGIATGFSNETDEWKQADAKAFLGYLDEQINVQTEVEKMGSNPDYVYSDDQGNKWLGMKKTGDTLGLFPTYKVVAFPVELFAQTNVEALTLADQKLEKDTEVSLGQTSLLTKKFQLKGKTEVGEIDSEILADRSQAENNELHLSLNAVEKTLKAELPSDLPAVKDIKLIVNGKEIAQGLEGKVKALENQTLTIHSQFTFEEGTYTTETAEVVVTPESDSLKVALDVSGEIKEQIKAAEKAKSEKEAAAQKEKEKEAATNASIEVFMNDYIASMRASIRNRHNQFAKYYDTSSAAYATMDNYVSGGDLAKLNIDYQETLDFDVRNITKEGDTYKVTVYNRFKEVYLNGKSDIVEKTQVFSLKTVGDSFQIYDISQY